MAVLAAFALLFVTGVAVGHTAAVWLHLRRARRQITAEQAWANGRQWGLDLAVRTVATHPLPSFTMSEGRGWIAARRDIRARLEHVRDQPDQPGPPASPRFPSDDPRDFED